MTLGACATVPPASDSLDAIGRDYVLLQLTIGEKEEGYIDAYYGPETAMAQAKADAPAATLDSLSARVAWLETRVAPFTDDGKAALTLEERRARFLAAQLVAARTRLRMMRGETLSFADEAEGLFGVRPELPPLESFDPLVDRIEALVPGEGPIWQRLESFRSRFNVPADKVEPVMVAAIAECKRRSGAYIAMPAHENFELALVTDKPWGGYNYYQGKARSKIEINTDLPIRLDRAIDLGCHEGYPGHHVYNALLERELVDERGWPEFAVYPLYSPQSFIAEGSANYGIELAFPGKEALAYNRDVLAPIAGISGEGLDRFLELGDLTGKLRGAQYTIAARFLAGEIDEAAASELLQRYNLVSPERAKQSLRFIKSYRSYIINYGLGLDMVRGYVEAAGPGQDVRWRRMEQLLSMPMLPSDLTVR
ncbi:hypothetical protein A6F68_01358 [Tsuneonella dongtanensis]|uniref:DUF885 domain-containing protein n=1 Tax=Tsuneonella dongtanensis TaxID=692370 RepID=A0A1B2ACU4_9SPHN|nr:hypothetical protein [Tsuneonella dongtanensis]ANY19875.1 hypothetical protein A6F68_01358 [Tsuneonella dongtanensis]